MDALEVVLAFAERLERGDADGAFRLGVLLMQRGALDEAAAAYGRASDRGHNAEIQVAESRFMDTHYGSAG